MIFVDPQKLKNSLPAGWEDIAAQLTLELKKKKPKERSKFIDECRDKTWAHPDLLVVLRNMIGNKCWYSEVPLEGADPNVDHFRPKGRVREIDDKLQPTKKLLPGYWWWAFEWRNFRLASMHSNQRRVDQDTNGGKADYFPVDGHRSKAGIDYSLCVENVVPLDPCSLSDVSLLWFDSNGAPGCSSWRRSTTDNDELRVRVTVWLYHLDKLEIEQRRRQHMEKIRLDLDNANAVYMLWKGIPGNQISKNGFDHWLVTIKDQLVDTSEFAAAKRCAVRLAVADFQWIEEFGLV